MSEQPESEGDLNSFRNQWRREINESQGSRVDETITDNRQDQAAKFFLQGIAFEKSKNYFEAIKCYKKAIQLDERVELKLYQASQGQDQKDDLANNNNTSNQKTENDEESDVSVCDDLIDRFQRQLYIAGTICETAYQAGTIRTSQHISSLPIEIFMLILKYVVSNDLDVKSLERFGMCCKGFLILSRDEEIWRLACHKVWGQMSQETMTWRTMFKSRCRVLFDGCYICKVNYQRMGESSFQDQFYRPVQIVEYFRLIRFLPSKQLLMMTSADDLQNSVNKLKNVKTAMQSRDILIGDYHYQDNRVLIVIKRNQTNATQKYKRKNLVEENDSSPTFFLELEIGNSYTRNFSKLMWKNYSVSQIRNGEEMSSDFDLRSSTKYPSFTFSPVKSFHFESVGILE